MAAGGQLGHWATAKAKLEFTSLDEALRDEAVTALREQGWSAPDETEVDTTYGSTHVSHFTGTGVPLVLLHGAGTSSLMWFPLVSNLVGRSIYAIDIVGEPGRSVQRRPIRDAGDLSSWLDEVLDALSLDAANLVGASYGGWIALNYARRTPRRVAALVLVEPVLGKVRPFFWVHGILVALAFVLPRPLSRRSLRRLHMNTDLLEDTRVRRYGFLGLTRYRRGLPKGVTPVTDAELASTNVPTLLLFGEHSEVHKSRAVAARVGAVMPKADTELVNGAGHALPVDKPDEVATRLRSFLAKARPASE